MYKVALDSTGNILSIFQGDSIFSSDIIIKEIPDIIFSVSTAIYNNIDKFDENLKPIPVEELVALGKIVLLPDEKIQGNNIVKLTEEEKIAKGLYSAEELAAMLEKEQTKKLSAISAIYDDKIANGYFTSTTLKIVVDCRKNSTKDDLDSVRTLIAYMTSNNVSKTLYRGYEQQSAGATLEQVNLLMSEMVQYKMDLFNKKDALKTAISNAKTIDEVQAISW